MKALQAKREAEIRNARDAARDRTGVEQAAAAEDIPDETQNVAEVQANASAFADIEDALTEAHRALQEQAALYKRCAERAEAREREAATARLEAESALERLENERTEAEAQRERAEAVMAQVRERVAILDDREAEIEARELEATTGFQLLRQSKLELIEAEIKQLRRDELERLEAEKNSARERIEQAERRLGEQERRLDEEQSALSDALAQLRSERITLEQREHHLDVEIAARAAGEVQRSDRARHLAEAKAGVLEAELERRQQELLEIQAKWAPIGITDPRAVLQERDALRQKNHELQLELDSRLGHDSLDRLRLLEDQNRELKHENERLEYDLEEERQRVRNDHLNVQRVKQLTDSQRDFELITRAYEKRIDELSVKWKQVVGEHENRTDPVFPKCAALDEKSELAETGLEEHTPPDLERLARGLQAVMWKNDKLAYSIDDVSCVLGGMAMSRFHILEGMSGIGKTSLPLALASALNFRCEVIEVQAGWRDQHDLFGHYNSFERRFQEQPFLTALYEASTPRHRNRPFFIVLDEMNLSRPEHYFWTVLDKVDRKDSSPIELAPAGAGRKPMYLNEAGTGIAIPDNVWFIGTANQDESTLEFADKTYNRSFLMELPADPPFAKDRGTVEPYSLKALDTAFKAAVERHADDSHKVRKFLEILAPTLQEAGIRVTPRVKSQLEKFVPVVVAARGTHRGDERRRNGRRNSDDQGAVNPVTLAADQFIATKVLRRLRARFEVRGSYLDRLSQTFEKEWASTFAESDPTRCRQVLAEERQRRANS
jgi:hypothetical protein